MRHLFLALAVIALAAVPALASEATFERNISVNGRVELSVAIGSGNIHMTHGSGNRVHIFGRVRTGWGGNEAKMREIAANPPIEQTGNIVRIGAHHEPLQNISIDYEIEAPADAFLEAGTGSGNVTDDGVGENAKLSSGSGSIHATGLHGGFSMNSGSGDIDAEQTGIGEVKVQTGSGKIELRNVNGGLRAVTGPGDIKVHGTPAQAWHLETGSGDVEIWSGMTPITLDAESGSGGIVTDQKIEMQGPSNRHHLTGKLNGGGPTVQIKTGSGNIHTH